MAHTFFKEHVAHTCFRRKKKQMKTFNGRERGRKQIQGKGRKRQTPNLPKTLSVPSPLFLPCHFNYKPTTIRVFSLYNYFSQTQKLCQSMNKIMISKFNKKHRQSVSKQRRWIDKASIAKRRQTTAGNNDSEQRRAGGKRPETHVGGEKHDRDPWIN